MHFDGKIYDDEDNGIYVTQYNNELTGEPVDLVVTQFEPVGARRAFPCFDEPDKKATFSLRLSHDKNLNAQFNGPLMSMTEPDLAHHGHVWSEFYPSPKMSSYLVAFAVSDYGKFEAVSK